MRSWFDIWDGIAIALTIAMLLIAGTIVVMRNRHHHEVALCSPNKPTGTFIANPRFDGGDYYVVCQINRDEFYVVQDKE